MKQSMMNTVCSAALFIFALNAYAAEPAAGQGTPMQGKPRDCDDKHADMQGMKGMDGMKMGCGTQKTARPATVSTGVVQEIDRTAKTITLKHGPIKNMNMPAMTMAFGVKDTAMLGKVKAGDKVDFTVENVENAPTVTMIQKQ